MEDATLKVGVAEEFRAKVEALLAEYPTMRLDVAHVINVNEMVPQQPPQPVAGTQTAPQD